MAALRSPDGDARGLAEKRDHRRSLLPLASARQVRERRTVREDPAGLSDEKRDRVREFAEFGV